MARFFKTKSLRKKVSAPTRVSAQQAFTGLRKDPEALRKAAAASAMRTLQNKLIEAKRAQIAQQKLDTISKVAAGQRVPQRSSQRKPLDLNALLKGGVNRGFDATKLLGRKAVDTGKKLAGKYYESQKPGIDFVGGLIEERRKEIEPAFKPFTKGEIEATKARREKPFLDQVKEVQQNPRAQGIAILSMDAFDPSGTGLSKKAVQKALKAGARTIGSVPIGMGKKAAQRAGQELLEQATKKTAKKAGSLIDDAVKPQTVDNYLKEVVGQQKTARGLENPGVKQKAKDFYREAKTKMVDFASPIEDVLRNAEKKGGFEILPEKHITNQIDRVLRAPTIAGQFARDNGLERVIKEVDDLDMFDQYLIARHTKDVAAKGIKTGRNAAMDAQLVEKFAPQYEEAAQTVVDYSQKMLDYSVDSGLIGKELADRLKKEYPNYVPLKRIFDATEKVDLGAGKAIASRGQQNIVQRIKGSEREIESPVRSLMEKTVDAIKQGEQNKAARMLASYKDLPGNPFGIEAVKAGEKAGKNSFHYLDNGVKKTFNVPPEIAKAARALDVQQLGLIARIFAAPVRVAKVGITGINLPFVLSNVARDQATAIINSNHSLKTSIANPKIFVGSLLEAVGHGKVYQEMAREGAIGTSFDLARNQAAPTIERLVSRKSLGGKIKYTVKHPSELLRAVEDVIARSEEFTRISQYKGTKEALIKKGMSEERATVGAARAARENTINFARHGEYGKILNSVWLYLNAGIQGTRTFIRNLSQRPVQTASKVALIGFTPVAAATAWNLADPKRREAYEDIAEYEKEGNLIIVPPNPTKDEQDKWNIIKVPLSQEISNLVGIARKGIEQANGLDPLVAQDIVRAFAGTVSPIDLSKNAIASSLIPQAIKPAAEVRSNYNFFTERPIVPEYMKELSPELQVQPYTSGTARKIGGALGASPLKTEAFIKGTLGSVGSQALNVSDRALATAGLIPKDQIGGQDVFKAIGARFMKARGGETELKESSGINQALREQADKDYLLREEAKNIHNELKQLPGKEANRRLNEIKRENEALYDKVKWRAENDSSDGMSKNERRMLDLKINNRARAEFIHDQLSSLTSNKEKNAYIKDLEDKGIVTDKVKEQLKSLARN